MLRHPHRARRAGWLALWTIAIAAAFGCAPEESGQDAGVETATEQAASGDFAKVAGAAGDSHPSAAWAAIAPSDPPLNLILISLDTTRRDHLSCYGFPEKTTPHLDRLAAEGVLFEDAYTSVPITLPAHCTMITGLDPYQHGVRHNGTYVLSDSAVTLAELLKAKGYDTGAVLGAFPLDRRFGTAQGFDHYDADFDKVYMEVPQRLADEVTRPSWMLRWAN